MPWRTLHDLSPTQDAFVAAFGQDKVIRPLAYQRVAWEAFEKLRLNGERGVYVALVPYEQYALRKGPAPAVAYRLWRWEEVDPLTGQVVLRSDPAGPSTGEISNRVLEHPTSQCRGGRLDRPVALTERLRPVCDDDAYLAQVRHVLSEIAAGRFYQLNLLRYFHLDVTRAALIELIAEHDAPYRAFFQGGDHLVASVSPERFLTATRLAAGQWSISTFPIKGTVAADSAVDLATSQKDRAELSMIIDLMRNDLGEVAQPGSVHVPRPPWVEDFGYVQHLMGEVCAQLSDTLSLGHLMRCTMPAGSITGAPKREVMAAIYEREVRERGYMMGNVFWVDLERGFLDSSVLIRTVQATENGYEFAAGSGIVIKSSPELELAEVRAKCQALGQPRETSWNSTARFT